MNKNLINFAFVLVSIVSAGSLFTNKPAIETHAISSNKSPATTNQISKSFKDFYPDTPFFTPVMDSIKSIDYSKFTVTTTTTSTFETTATTTTTAYPYVIAKNPTAISDSVSSIRVEWEDDGHSYNILATTDAPYAENITYLFKSSNVCYITGLRENSNYHITLMPNLNNGENAMCIPFELDVQTPAVEVIQEFEHEDGCTGCFAGERASGLTAMPSSGAIYGSYVDNVTGTGIRRKSNGDYCCAMGLAYGVCGDRFLITLDNGIQFTTQICDSKGWADDADGDDIPDGRFHWFGGTGNGKCVIEFIYDDYNLPFDVAFYGSWGIHNWSGLNLTSNIASIQKINY